MGQMTPDVLDPEHASSGGDGDEAGTRIEARTPLQLAWARFRKDRVSLVAGCVILLLVTVAILSWLDVWTQIGVKHPNVQDFENGVTPEGQPTPPRGMFPLGSDNLGRDILSRILYGAKISMVVGLAATAIELVIGIVFGLFAGYYGKWVDTTVSRLIEVVLSVPLLFAAIALAALRQGGSLNLTIIVIALFGWTYIARIVRGQVLSLREKEFVEAARSLGASDIRIIFVDILPNLVAPIIIYATLLIPTNILLEAALSFLGVGVPPPTASWGSMLEESLDYYRAGTWWFFLFPGLALFTTVLAFNLFGDGVRDALDPRAGRVMAKK